MTPPKITHVSNGRLAAAVALLLVASLDVAVAQTTTTRDHRPPQVPPGWGQSERPGRHVSGAGKSGGVAVSVTKNSGRR